jgi:hypothetical protein
VLPRCGGLERVGGVEVARERRKRERGGAAVGEQEVEGAQGDRAGSAVVGAVVEQAADRREGGFYVLAALALFIAIERFGPHSL